jgi:oligogalacturonide lyase
MESTKGSVFPPEHSSYLDEATGARVHQITSHPSINHPSYFLHSSFTPDQRRLLFTSYRTGQAQLFEAAFPEGEIRQLTDGEPIHPFSPAIAAAGRSVFFVRGGAVWEIDRAGLEERLVTGFDGQLGECSLSADGVWFTAAARLGQQWGIVVGETSGNPANFIPYPRTVIHPQFSPLDAEWIEFAADPAPRMFRMRRDGSGLECLYEHDNDEFVVHETFLGSTGDLVFTVWPNALKRMNWQTRRITTIADCNAWHICPNRAGTKVLCDTNHPDVGLQLIDVASGERRTVCLSKSSSQGTQWKRSRYALAEDWEAAKSAAEKGKALSWMEMAADSVYGPQWTHPHPSFSPDETMVAFASDRSGHPQVYVAEVPEALRK